MTDYSTILNDSLDISGIDHTFSFSNDLLNPEILELLKKTYRREIIVVCESLNRARYLMNEMIDCLWPNVDKVDLTRCVIKVGYETWIFISQDELDIKLTGRHRAEVAWDYDFLKGLEIYKTKKESNNA